MTMFVVGGNSVPMMVRALISLALTLCMLPSIPAVASDLMPFSGLGILITIKESLIGVAIGFMTSFIAQSFTIAGQAIAMQTGLGFASLVDPVSGTNSPVVGQFFTVLCTLVFFCVDGHLIFFRMVLISFETMPIGGPFFNSDNLHALVYFGTLMFQCALTMSLSAICTMLVVNFTLGVMTKASPQLNIFSLGFAITMIVGILVLNASMNAFMANFTTNFNNLLENTCKLINTSCQGLL